MALPKTRSYKLTTQQPVLINIVIFMFFAALFQVFGLIVFGLVIGVLLAVGLYIYQRINNPGAINHYLYYIKVPNILSGNRKEEYFDNK